MYYYLFLLLFVILGIIHVTNSIFKSSFCHTQAYSSSFFPSVISLWNSVPDDSKTSSSLSSFKHIILLLSQY